MSKHMMLSPEAFLSGFTDSSYEKLIVERDSLIADIKKHEEKEKKRDRSGKE